MKKILSSVAFCVLIAFGISGCANTNAKYFGGEMTVELPAGQKLQEVTWKDSELWYLTKPMTEDEEPEMWTFQEKTDFGVIEGTVYFKENK